MGAKGPESISPVAFEIVRTVTLVVTLLFVSSGLMYIAESPVNPAFSNFFVSLYFGLITLTTVGFGDITPCTVVGRLVMSMGILLGIGMVPLQLSRLAEAYFDERAYRKRDREKAKERRAMNDERLASAERRSVKEALKQEPGLRSPDTFWCGD